MAVACASRFAVLKIEDDEIMENVSTDKPTQSAKNKITSNKTAPSSENKTKPKKKKKPSNDVAELQSLAFGSGTTKQKSKGANSQSSNNNSSGNSGKTSAKQWEEWKKKDNEFVSEVYEQDLQQAILLSKLDYEQKKDVYDAMQKENEQLARLGTAAQKKKKKGSQRKEKSSMSLDEFQNLPTQVDTGSYSRNRIDALEDFSSPEKLSAVSECDFFEKVDQDAEKIIVREQRQRMYQKVEELGPQRLHFQEELEKKDEQIKLLSEEIKSLKEELKDVKARNKRLCNILAEGEMKEKAQILIQIEELTNVKDELTEQLNEFHVSLEQERSKVHALQMELKKCQGSKKDRRDSK